LAQALFVAWTFGEGATLTAMSTDQPRPSYAPENRSPNAGKFVAIAVFTLLLLGTFASIIVVLTRGSSGIVPADAPTSGQVEGEPSRGEAPQEEVTAPSQ
jgi:hypothetical protein